MQEGQELETTTDDGCLSLLLDGAGIVRRAAYCGPRRLEGGPLARLVGLHAAYLGLDADAALPPDLLAYLNEPWAQARHIC